MYNSLHQYLTKNKILSSKQSGFQVEHSTENTSLQFCSNSFENNKYTLSVFIDLPKAFQYFLKN